MNINAKIILSMIVFLAFATFVVIKTANALESYRAEKKEKLDRLNRTLQETDSLTKEIERKNREVEQLEYTRDSLLFKTKKQHHEEHI